MKLAMRFVKSHSQKERLLRTALQEMCGGRGHFGNVIPFRRQDLIVADDLRIFRDMLHSGKGGTIAVRPQPMKQVLVVVVQRKPAMRQTQHPVVMRALARQ